MILFAIPVFWEKMAQTPSAVVIALLILVGLVLVIRKCGDWYK